MGLDQSFTIFKKDEPREGAKGLDIFVFRKNYALNEVMAGFTDTSKECVWMFDITKDNISSIKKALKIDRDYDDDDFDYGERLACYEPHDYFEIVEGFKRVETALEMGFNVEYWAH